MRGYQTFSIAPFSRGIDKKNDAWLSPADAFTDIENMWIDNGIIKKRGGSSVFGQIGRVVLTETGFANPSGNRYTRTLSNTPLILRSVKIYDDGSALVARDDGKGNLTGNVDAGGNNVVNYSTGAIDVTFSGAVVGTVTAEYHYSDTGTDRIVRGIHLRNKDNGAFELLAFDKRRANRWDNTNRYFENLYSGTAVTGETGFANPGGNQYTKTLANLPVVPYTVKVYDDAGTQVAWDDGNGNFTGDVDATGTNTINYTTGAIDITFAAAIAGNVDVDYYDGGNPVYDIWNSANLISSVDWYDNVWICDDATNIHIYNGTYMIDITDRLEYASGSLLTTAKFLIPFQERLLAYNTTEDGTSYPNRVRWSAQGNPLSFSAENVHAWRDDIAGKGGFNDVPINEEIVSISPQNNSIITFLERSIFSNDYTANPDLPFRWREIRGGKDNLQFEAPFGTLNLPGFAVGLGKFEMISCDGRDTRKFNEIIPDFPSETDYDLLSNAYAFIEKDKRQVLLAYPNREEGQGHNDKVLVYNYEHNVFSEYQFTDNDGNIMNVNCFGEWNQSSDVTYTDLYNGTYWDDITSPAEYQDYAGNTYKQLALQTGDLLLLCGSDDGYVYDIGQYQENTDNNYGYSFSVTSKRYNPFNEKDKKLRIGAIDFLVSGGDGLLIDVDIMLDFNDTPIITKSFVCSSTPSKEIKRIIVNIVGQNVRFKLKARPSNVEAGDGDFFELHQVKLYFKEAGRFV